ncbi:MAG: hypothetical protein ACXWZL_06630, partial [Mycobacterium sp.]
LLARLTALPWTDVPVGHTTTDRRRGRIEERTVKVVTVTVTEQATAAELATWIRQHWRIENKLHC